MTGEHLAAAPSVLLDSERPTGRRGRLLAPGPREAYVSVRTDPVGAGFGGEIRLGQYADFRLSTKRARAEEVRRSRSDIAQAHDEQDYLYFLFQTLEEGCDCAHRAITVEGLRQEVVAAARADASECLVRRSEALTYMRTHLADPDLDAESIADGLHLSRRTLFRLFEETGESGC